MMENKQDKGGSRGWPQESSRHPGMPLEGVAPGGAWAPGGPPLAPFRRSFVILLENILHQFTAHLEIFCFSNSMSTFIRLNLGQEVRHRQVANCVKQAKTT